MRAAQTTCLAAAALQAAAAMQMAAIRQPAPMQPTATAPIQPTARLSRRCILAAPVATLPWRATAPLVVALPFRANALYDTKTVDAAKNTYDVADASKCKAYLPLLDASGKTLDELAANWDRIATDGDSVRRYLGTVGVTSPLFKIRGGLKGVLKAKDLPDAFDAVACVEINQCVGCTRQFFTKSFLGDDAAVLARSSGEEPASPRHRAGVASMAWRTTRRFRANAP